ncbi:hypothetical protein [Sediminicoccus sp. BL-A-41-H5]|uniref:hypothetical protein n=1 Tax=Sediminicoccus sp. BL-A-41-H5 TaxID=3421106 RepID=UPI003D67BB6C
MKAKPLSPLSPAPGWEAAPFRVIGQGCDTYAETFNIEWSREARQAIEAARAAADMDPRRKDGAPLNLCGEEWQVMPHGAKGGVVHVLHNPEIMLLCRSFNTEWSLTARYRSAGIWGHGLPALRERVAAFVARAGTLAACEDNPRVSRFDYAIDLHAPGFAPSYSMGDRGFCFPQGTAKLRVIGCAQGPETFTLGSMAGLQVQLYDKCKEIRQASGKDWFHEIWGGVKRDVWRIECRFSGAWMKERGIRSFEAVESSLRPMISTALHAYRLTDGSASRARRANVHPLWWHAMEAAGGADFGAAVVNLSTMKRDEFHAMMRKNAIGTARAALVALHGEIDQAAMDDFMSDVAASEQFDPRRKEKISRLQERHRWIERPA